MNMQQLADSSQIEPDDEWNEPEDLTPLNIQSPPDWNDYNKYLLEGGKLEYSEWTERGTPAVLVESLPF